MIEPWITTGIVSTAYAVLGAMKNQARGEKIDLWKALPTLVIATLLAVLCQGSVLSTGNQIVDAGAYVTAGSLIKKAFQNVWYRYFDK
jgi:hypothetical protein